MLCAFDLIELDGRDLRKAPIEQRKDLLAKVMRPVRRSHPGTMSAAKFREYAAEHLDWAKTAKSDREQQTFEQMAGAWEGRAWN